MEEVIKVRRAGLNLIGILKKPKLNKAQKCPIVIIMHGFTSNCNTAMHVKIAEELLKNGIASLRFDFNGHGESEGFFEDMTVMNEIEDAREKDELRNNARPELTEGVDNIDEYDVIFLVYPNWWGTIPMPVYSFLEEYNLSGKTIIPCCTHEGSGMGHSESDIKEACPDAEVRKGIAIHGGSVKNAKNAIVNWIKK